MIFLAKIQVLQMIYEYSFGTKMSVFPLTKDAEIFIGKWKKAQNKAIEETIKLTNNSIEEYNFDKLVDEKTVKYYVEDNT